MVLVNKSMNLILISIPKAKKSENVSYDISSLISHVQFCLHFFTLGRKKVERKGVSIRYSWMKRRFCVGFRKGSIGYSFIFFSFCLFLFLFSVKLVSFFRVNERLLVHLEDISHFDRHSLLLFVVTLLSISLLDIK